MNLGIRQIIILVTVFCVAFLSVFVIRKIQSGHSLLDFISGNTPSESQDGFTLPNKAPLKLSDVDIMHALNEESAALVKSVVPSVVSIDTAGVRHEQFRDMMGRTWVQPRTVQGQGSGVIVTEEGHVLTNHHVVQGNPQIRITMHNGTVHSATLVGSDPAVDIAVLKINHPGPFPPLKIGNSDEIEVGHIVFAVGSPFGLGESVTDGKISAKKRTFSDSRVDLLQTSAPINPGNSGGPLVNITGEIIGINSRIYSTDKKNPGFQGISFSIPSNAAFKTMQDILSRGRPMRGFLGMAFEELDPYSRQEFGYHGQGGVRILGLINNSPAKQAGLQTDDIIISYEGKKISSIRNLVGLIQQSEVKSKITLEVWRNGAKHNVIATIGEADDFNQQILKDEQEKITQRIEPETILKTIGLIVRDPNTNELQNGTKGVIVQRILPNSNVAGKIITGDNIRSLNGRVIKDNHDFNTRLAASAAVQDTELEIRRASRTLRILISPVR